jgi:hypothetical protein
MHIISLLPLFIPLYVYLFSILLPVSHSKHPRTIGAPAISSSSSGSLIHRSSSFLSSSYQSTHTTRITPVYPTTRTYSVQVMSHLTTPTHTRTSRPTRPNQKPINITFEVLAGILATGVLLGFLLCCYNYRKTPRRDRIADVLHRHHLQQELEQLGRNSVALRLPSLREPAPPYFPSPPSYEQTSSIHQGASPPRADHSAVPTCSPSPSPPISQRIPLPSHPLCARRLPDLIPPIPSGYIFRSHNGEIHQDPK